MNNPSKIQAGKAGISGSGMFWECPYCRDYPTKHPIPPTPIIYKGGHTHKYITLIGKCLIYSEIRGDAGNFTSSIVSELKSEPVDFCPKCGRKLEKENNHE